MQIEVIKKEKQEVKVIKVREFIQYKECERVAGQVVDPGYGSAVLSHTPREMNERIYYFRWSTGCIDWFFRKDLKHFHILEQVEPAKFRVKE